MFSVHCVVSAIWFDVCFAVRVAIVFLTCWLQVCYVLYALWCSIYLLLLFTVTSFVLFQFHHAFPFFHVLCVSHMFRDLFGLVVACSFYF